DAGPLAPEAGAQRRADADAGRGPLDAAAPASFDAGAPGAGDVHGYAPLTEFGAGRNVVLERDYVSFPNADDPLTSTQVMRTKDSLLGPGSAPSRNACVADFNNDGLYDVFIVTGSSESYPPLGEADVAATDAGQHAPNDRSLLYVGAPGGTSSEQAGAAGIADGGDGRWVTCFDYDRDGDVDVFVMNNNSGRLY